MGFFSKLFGYDANNVNSSRYASVSSVLSADHPAVMLYNLTRQCFTNQDAALVVCSKDIIREAELQYKMGDKYRDRINNFFFIHPNYQQRLKTHIIKFKDNLYSLSFVLEIICISRSDVAREMLVRSNFVYQNAAGDLILLPFIDYNEEQLSKLDSQEKEELLFEAIDNLKQYLDDIDLDFIDHIENVLLEINSYYSNVCNEFKGYDDFYGNESQYPAIACYIDTYEMVHSYRYNYSTELSTTYRYFSKENKIYNLRIRNILETLDCYIEMCTRYKVYMTINFGYLKLYTNNYNGDNFRNKIKNSLGGNHSEAIDQCLKVMCKSNK